MPFPLSLRVAVALLLVPVGVFCDLGADAARSALKLAEAGNLDASLPLFQTACRKSPDNADYWNNIGVTYLRLQRYSEAEASFMGALMLQRTHRDATGNLRETREYMAKASVAARTGQELSWAEVHFIALGGELAFEDGVEDAGTDNAPPAVPAQQPQRLHPSASALSATDFALQRGIRHKVRRLPRVRAADLHRQENIAFARGLKPFVLLGSVGNASALRELGEPSFFTDGPYAQYTADYYPNNMVEAQVHPFLTPLAVALRDLQHPSARFPPQPPGRVGRYIHFNMGWPEWRDVAARLKLRLSRPMSSPDEWISSAFPAEEDRTEFQVRQEHL